MASTQRNDVQGLRAIAVVAVILFHVNKEWLPGGFVGVDIFLVISGYLITSLILRHQQEQRFSFMGFYGSRIRRIVPAYLVMLACISLLLAVLLIPQDFNSYYKSLKAALYFNSNNYFARHYDYFAPAAHESPLLHTWSLAVEMQFYLLLPALVLYLPRRFIVPILLALATALTAYASIRLGQGQRQGVYFSLAARIPEFIIGSLLALRPIGQNWGQSRAGLVAAIGLSLIVASVWLITETSSFPGILSLLPCLGAACLIAARASSINQKLATRPFVWIGDLSYSLYLWHWPILAGLRYGLETYDLPAKALLIFIPLTIACAYLSYRFIEIPFRKKKLLANRLPTALLVGSVVTSLSSAQYFSPNLVKAWPVEWTRYGVIKETCHGNIVGDCAHGDKSSTQDILLLGDSHAAHLNIFADIVGLASKTKLYVISASSCMTIDGFDVERIPEPSRKDCRSQISAVKEHLVSAKAIIVAGKWLYHAQSEAFMVALDRFLEEAGRRKQPVLLLAQIPMLTSNVQRYYRLNLLGWPNHGMSTDPGWHPANEKIRKLAAKYPHVRFVDFSAAPLFKEKPFENGIPIYYDKHHLNEIGSRRYGEIAASGFTAWIKSSLQ